MTRRRDWPPPELPGTVDPDAFINLWVGTVFAWDGRDRGGIDCWGLVWRFHRDCLGLELPDWSRGDKGHRWIREVMAGEEREHWQRHDGPVSPCIVLARPGRRPAHVGIFWRGGVLHAQDGRGVVWEPMATFARVYPDHQFGDYVEAWT